VGWKGEKVGRWKLLGEVRGIDEASTGCGGSYKNS
jgi:hypothetical protein